MKYEKWIDVAKGIGILLVIIGHSPFSQSIINIIYTFHMPLFFFLSGYLLNWQKYKESMAQFISSKSKRLVYPYFLTNIFMFSTYYLISYLGIYQFKSNSWSIKSLIGMIYGNGAPLHPSTILTNTINYPSWFLLCLFCGYIILYIITYFYEKHGIAHSCLLCICFVLIGFETSKYMYLPWGLDIACVSMVYMFPGYIMSHYNIQSVHKALEKKYFNLFFILFLLLVVEVNGYVDMNERNYGNLLFFTMGGFLGIYITINLSKKIIKLDLLSKFLIFLGKNSIIILLYHSFTPDLFLHVANMFININKLVYNSGILYTFCVLAISVLTVTFINNMPILKKIY